MLTIRWLALLCGALLTVTGLAVPAAAAGQTHSGSRPTAAGAPIIRETVWVDTGLDLDGDGKKDRVAADIARPDVQQKTPVIMDASPYYSCCGRGNESEKKTYDDQGRPVGFPLFYDNYFVPRGYSTVLVDLAGTNRSDGCVDIGSKSDITSAKAVIDWLNGRAPGYASKDGGAPVKADWSNGKVGMIGKSYDGTVANGVAATGVDGLKTIVPISAISAWYDYYRGDGVSFPSNPVELAQYVEENKRPQCDGVKQEIGKIATDNGDVTPMWTDRDYVKDAAKVKASVFVVHGRGDLNVKTLNFGQWWDALAKNNVRRKIWLSQTGHVDPFDFRRKEWVDTLQRWFDHELLGQNNGVDTEPGATIEREPNKWVDEQVWAGDQIKTTPMYPKPGTSDGLGELGNQPAPPNSNAAFTDDNTDETSWAAKPDQPSPSRTLFTTGPLQKDLRLAGDGSITVKATPSTPSAHLSAMLVDYGPATTRDYLGNGEGIRTLGTESCWGESRPGDDACYKDTEATTRNVDFEIISRGWADLANYQSLSQTAALNPGTPYTMTFRMAPNDHVVPAGHRLGLIVAGTDSSAIVSPAQPGKVTLDLAGTAVQLPVVGGAAALNASGARLSSDEPIRVRPDRIPPRPNFRINRDN